MEKLTAWLDSQNILYNTVDSEVVEIPGFGKLFLADLSGVKSIFRQRGEELVFNLMENPATLMEEGIFHVAFPFGRNWYYYDLREEFAFHILKHIGRPIKDRPIPFVNLGVHTPFELLNASGEIATWIRKAKWLGHTALGICDRNTLAATLQFQKECDKAGLRPVFGYSLTMEHEGQKIELKVYSLTQQGLSGLLRILKEIMVDDGDETLPLSSLLKYSAGNCLVFGTLSTDWMVRHRDTVGRMREAFDMAFYQVDLSEYKADRIDSLRLHAAKTYFRNFYDRNTGSFVIEPILITDCYYIDRDEAPSKVVLNKIATGAAHEQSDDQYYKNVDEHYATLRPLFGEEWDFDALFTLMCRNTVRVAEVADARFATGQMFMPQYMMRQEEIARYGNRRSMFRRLLDEGLAAKVPVAARGPYYDRLEEEVYIIESTNNVDYFLIQWDMIQEAKRRGIVTGIGRGSAGGSLVAYLLGITSIDPIRYGLLFSRFLVPERCGLKWSDAITTVAGYVPLHEGEQYVEIESEGMTLCLHPDARLRVRTSEGEHAIYADELSCGDEILFDRRDCLWTLNEKEKAHD